MTLRESCRPSWEEPENTEAVDVVVAHDADAVLGVPDLYRCGARAIETAAGSTHALHFRSASWFCAGRAWWFDFMGFDADPRLTDGIKSA